MKLRQNREDESANNKKGVHRETREEIKNDNPRKKRWRFKRWQFAVKGDTHSRKTLEKEQDKCQDCSQMKIMSPKIICCQY